MSIERRLHQLESALPVQAAVRHWLVEAHGHGGRAEYTEWLAEQPRDAAPHRRVRAQVEAAALAACPNGSADGPLAAWQAGRDAIFLLEVVAVANDRAEALLEPGFLRAEALEAELRLLWLEVRTGVSAEAKPPGRSEMERWMGWCIDYSAWAIILATAEVARMLLEDRYLGAPALFPDLAEAWATLLARVDGLGDLAASGAQPSEGARTYPWPPDPHGLVLLAPEARHASARAYARSAAADLVNVARANTLAYLGDRDGANAILARRLRRYRGLSGPVDPSTGRSA
jgi:hypothetical protein